jgi:osmotically-inducible protein OsmY
MRKVYLLIGLGSMFLPAMVFSAPLSNMDAVALYAADASASLAMPVARSQESTSDDALARQVTDAISGIVASGAAQVNVQAKDGRVTLKGRVVSEPVVSQLMDTAKTVNGVKEVKSELKLSAS